MQDGKNINEHYDWRYVSEDYPLSIKNTKLEIDCQVSDDIPIVLYLLESLTIGISSLTWQSS